jgi:exodeoxyribonuclease VII large subunit
MESGNRGQVTAAKKLPTEEETPVGSDASHPLSVSELAAWIDDVVEDGIGYIWVQGEVRDLKAYPSGHTYCSLTDGKASVNVAFFSRIELPEGIANGALILVLGHPQFYAPTGRLSVIAEEVHLSGEGELWAMIEKTRQKLDAEGLFDESRKRPLPLLPATVGVVCGFDAAVKRDILAARQQRFPGYPLVFEEVTVQGDRAVSEITAAMERLARNPQVEVIILARGGGSLADLAPFYDENLCRAIAKCPVPVVSAIGHEKDNPLSDLVADARASTPSRAAMEVIPEEFRLRDRIDQALDAISNHTERRLETAYAGLRLLEPYRIFRESHLAPKELYLSTKSAVLAEQAPLVRLERERSRLAAARVFDLISSRVSRDANRLESLSASLDALSPRSALERGFAVLRSQSGEIIRSPNQAPEGTELSVTLARGMLDVISKGESRSGGPR